MKNTFLLVVFAGALQVTFAQEVIATQGDTYTGVSTTLDFTIGEVVIQTGTNATTDLTQGFHQTNWRFNGLEDHAPGVNIAVFPNPASDYLTIQTTDFENVRVVLYDASGRMVLSDRLSSEQTLVRVDQLATGNYSLVLSNAGQPLKTIKLIKTL